MLTCLLIVDPTSLNVAADIAKAANQHQVVIFFFANEQVEDEVKRAC